MAQLESILDQVSELAPDDRLRLKRALDAWVADEGADNRTIDHATVINALRQRGHEVTAPPAPAQPTTPFKPIKHTGRPVSETLVEDRG